MPRNICNEIVYTKNLIAYQPKVSLLCIINTNKDDPILRKQSLKKYKPGIHHTKPLIVAAQVLAFFTYNLSEPFANFRVIDIIIVDPALISGIIWRIDIDAFNTALVLW